jgi:hypothetical protein
MEIITKRPIVLGTVRIEIGTPLTVPDSIGGTMIERSLADPVKPATKHKKKKEA